MACYTDLVLNRRASELIMRIAVSNFCAGVLVSFLLSAFVGGLVGFSGDFAGIDDIAKRGLLPHLPVGVL